jgi:hypothetical protein
MEEVHVSGIENSVDGVHITVHSATYHVFISVIGESHLGEHVASYHHWEVGDASTLDKIKGDFDTISSAFPFLQDKGGPGLLMNKLLLHVRERQADKSAGPSNIDFDLLTWDEKKQFSTDLNADLGILKLSQIGNMDVSQARLKNVLEPLGQLEEIEL